MRVAYAEAECGMPSQRSQGKPGRRGGALPNTLRYARGSERDVVNMRVFTTQSGFVMKAVMTPVGGA